LKGYITARIKENPDANIKILAIVQAAGDMGQKIIEVVRPYKKNVGLILICPPGKMLQQVRKQYANEEYSFIEFKVLNIEKSPLEQGFQSDSMEIVIAESTVSAAKQINTALNQLKKLLKTNGLLMLTEVTQVQEFASLILGLTSAWWNFEDSENRLKGSPLVSPVRWRQMLEQGGFRRVRVAGAVPVGEEKLTESIIIGESDGKAEFEKGEMLKSTVHAVIEPVNPSSGHGDAENNNETENELEKNIAEIWKEVLDIDHVGYHDNFRELGGDSILITQIISRMDKLYPFKLDLRSLYDATTVAEMAEIVERELILKLQEIPDDELRHMI
jgi:ubiquinone/menaquinone biosynthesis C-methylase UbiE/acyl carrier protein